MSIWKCCKRGFYWYIFYQVLFILFVPFILWKKCHRDQFFSDIANAYVISSVSPTYASDAKHTGVCSETLSYAHKCCTAGKSIPLCLEICSIFCERSVSWYVEPSSEPVCMRLRQGVLGQQSTSTVPVPAPVPCVPVPYFTNVSSVQRNPAGA